MAAILIAFAKIKNPAKLQEYASAAAPTLAAAGGSIMTRAKFKLALAGSLDVDSCLIVKFETVAAAQAWYQSPAYQALVPLREEVMTPTFLVLEEPT